LPVAVDEVGIKVKCGISTDSFEGGLVFEYLIVMLAFTVPFISFAVYKRRFAPLCVAGLMGLAIGLPWDLISAGYFHTWFWNGSTLTGLWMGPLPLEEILFMILVPMMLIGAALVFRINLMCEPNKRILGTH
jgi:lycopene cyclase domain-containing protein